LNQYFPKSFSLAQDDSFVEVQSFGPNQYEGIPPRSLEQAPQSRNPGKNQAGFLSTIATSKAQCNKEITPNLRQG